MSRGKTAMGTKDPTVEVLGRTISDARATSEGEDKVAKAVEAMRGGTKAASATIGRTNLQSYLKAGRSTYPQTNSV